MSGINLTIENKALGVIKAFAAGDALGWPQELRGNIVGGQQSRDARRQVGTFESWNRYAGGRFNRYVDEVLAGEYSDDTQMFCMVARSCLTGSGWPVHLVNVELPTWPLYQRGGGAAVLAAAASWRRNREPWRSPSSVKEAQATERYLNAGANGVAMRIAPHVIYLRSRDTDPRRRLKKIAKRVVQDGVATHGHPRALVGALVYAAALDFVLDSNQTLSYGEMISAAELGLVGADEVFDWLPGEWLAIESRAIFTERWNRTLAEASSLLEIVERSLLRGSMSSIESTLEELGVFDERVGGSGTISAMAAIYLASRSADRPLSGLTTAAFLRKADTDTLAAMTGGLLGGLHGPDWLGDLGNLQDVHYLEWLARELAGGRDSSSSFQSTFDPRPLLRNFGRDLVRSTHRDSEGWFPDGRAYLIAAAAELSGSTPIWRFRLQLGDGQTAICDIRLSPEEAKEFRSQKASRRETPDRTASLVENFVVVTLPTADAQFSAEFYSLLLGKEVPVEAGEVVLDTTLRLQEVEGFVAGSSEVRISITTSNMSMANAILGGAAGSDSVTGKDPDGRQISVRRAGGVGK